MSLFVNISGYDLDFISLLKNKFNYYYADSYSLSSNHYKQSFHNLKFMLEKIQKNDEFNRYIIPIIKMKLLIKKPCQDPWDFPIAVHNNQITCGCGRILIDKFVFNKENKQTIFSCDYNQTLPYMQLNSLAQLSQCIKKDDLRIHVKNGGISAISKHSDDFGDLVLKYVQKYKDVVLQEIQQLDLSDNKIIDFLGHDSLPNTPL
jgi:hypothetical protein